MQEAIASLVRALAIARHFFSEARDLKVKDVIEWFASTYYNSDKKVIDNTMQFAREAFHASPFSFEVHTDPFQPLVEENQQNAFRIFSPHSYAERVEAYLNARWLGYCNMNFKGAERGLTSDPLPDRRGHYKTGANHMVVIDGIRSYWLREGEGDDWSASLQTELHIVCSVNGAYWIDLGEWLEFHGGLFIWWVRPRDEEYLDERP